MDSIEISKYILNFTKKEDFDEIGDGVSNLKLQKLLFYVQKTYYSLNNKLLFDDSIETWKYGPVAPKAYHYFKKYQANNIDIFELEKFIKNRKPLDMETLLILEFVWDNYSIYSAKKLVDMTHKDKAWKNNYIPDLNIVIPVNDFYDEEIKNRFLAYKTEINNLSKIKVQ